MRGFVLWILCAVLSATLIINLCSAVYGCGCLSWWAGAADQCNIHQHHARHCPLCVTNGAAAAVFGTVLVTQALLIRRWAGWRGLFAGALAFPVVGTIAMWLLGWLKGYWR